MNWIILEPHEIGDGGVAVLRDRRARHLREVLGSVAGDRLRVGVVDGLTGSGLVRTTSDTEARIEIALESPARAPWVDVVLAIPRPRVLKRLWPQLAMLGVGNVELVNAARVERCYFGTHWLEPEHYRPLLLAGLEQAGHTWLPRVTVRRAFKRFVERELDEVYPDSLRLLAHPGPATPLPSGLLNRRALLAIGPEGGWTPYECDLLAEHGFTSFALGSRVLRSDTACVALLSVLGHAVELGRG